MKVDSPAFPKILTIGVYGYSEETFFQTLIDAKVDTFCDIRRRRGVRGAQYAFANSNYLQVRLAKMGIQYIHLLDLAPTADIRKRQKSADKFSKVAKRNRTRLTEAFVKAYTEEILSSFDAKLFLKVLGDHSHVVVLFCVEKEPAACHRSLVAKKITQDLGLEVEHKIP